MNFIRMSVVSVCAYRLGILLLRTQYTLTGRHTSSSMCAGVPQLKPAASCEQVVFGSLYMMLHVVRIHQSRTGTHLELAAY